MPRDNLIAATLVSIIVIIMVGILTAMVITRTAPLSEWQTTYLNLVGGAVISAFTTVVGYWLGSSNGSKSKDEVLATMANNSPKT